ncbi:hypothetical protein [Hymenobacter koreensis]|uniref:hypothetical protein n=1 Tax=Hymenobacter koreensis TaxID=1084523 RepID=UPI0031E4FC3C
MHSYISFDPAAEVNGDTLQALLEAFQVRYHAQHLLRQHGLPAAPKVGNWYPLQAWLDLLADVEHTYGEQTVYAVGLHIVTCSRWPAGLTSLNDALSALDEACRSNVEGENIGYYRVQQLAPGDVRVLCLTPTPVAFEHGLLTGMARKFRPEQSLRIRVEKEATPANSPPLLKWFRIKW